MMQDVNLPEAEKNLARQITVFEAHIAIIVDDYRTMSSDDLRVFSTPCKREWVVVLAITWDACLGVVVLTHVAERFHLFPKTRWGQPSSAGDYLDLIRQSWA